MDKRNIYLLYKKNAQLFNKLVYILVVINVLALCANTFDETKAYSKYFHILESVLTIVFTLEYVLRCIIAYSQGALFKYMFSLLGIVDLISILPYYLSVPKGHHSSFIKIIRLFRLLTMFKMYRYSEHVKTIVDVIYHKKGDLIATFVSIFFVIVFCSYATFVLEHEVQPEKFKNILDALWWGIATIGTIGYGDTLPITFGGKLIASFLTLLGVGLVAIPSAILSAGFVELQNDKKARKNKNTDIP
ncbi:MAG TPA: ion transporter [Cytophagales bacterium]|nr:ion transporter [Cytophagales bacterium]